MNEWLYAAGRRFARLTTRAVVAEPRLWRLFRPLMRAQFDSAAATWDERRDPNFRAPLEAALDRLARPPARVLDVGTGTGQAARLVATRFPSADVVGVDISPRMIEEAFRLVPEELRGRVRYEVADASRLPFEDGAFDLVTLLNMIPFFDEVARLTAAGGTVVVAFSYGPETPISVASDTLRERFRPLGFDRFEDVRAGQGTAFVARRADARTDSRSER